MITQALFAFLIITSSVFAQAPTFSAAFSPSTIGPGSSSTLTFTIENVSGSPIRNLNFSNSLPAGVTIAPGPALSSDCLGATLGGVAGGTTITLADGGVPAGATCSVSVNVTSSTPGMVTNLSGDLTSDGGNSGTATADLTISTDYPGFSMSLSPASVPFQERSTLTYTFDNSANAGNVAIMNFTNTLPAGLEVASPANASTDCGEVNAQKVISAVPGGNVVSLRVGTFNFDGYRALAAGQVCIFSVDVVGVIAGTHENVTGSLTLESTPIGFAAETLEVTTPSLVSVLKSFVNNPVTPGGVVEIQYTVSNRDRASTATSISFTDDLDATLSGLVALDLPLTDVCGSGSSVSGTSLISFAGGTLGAGESCSFSVSAQLPMVGGSGSYSGSTSMISADLGGRSVTGDPASATLYVNSVPTISRRFLTTTVGVGSTVTAEYVITNTDSSTSITDIAFVEDLANVIPGITAGNLPADGFCGAGSVLTFTSFNPPPPGDALVTLSLAGGSLDPGASCTFTLDFNIPEDSPAGTVQFDTGPLTAAVSGSPVTGAAAVDTLNVVGGLSIQKVFNDSALLPGGTVALEYTIALDENAPAGATDVAFTDDLDSVISGLVATGLPQVDLCGIGSALTGTDIISFSGGSLNPGESCTFIIAVQVPGDAPFGSFTSTTSNLSADIDGFSLSIPGASDDLDVISLSFTHRFVGSPYVAGEDAVVEYTLTNNDSANAATGIIFSHDLGDVFSGLVPEGLPENDICGVGSQLINSGDRVILLDGVLQGGESCSFSVTVPLPATIAAGSYSSTTATISSSSSLEVVEPLTITKDFVGGPVIPGNQVVLEYNISNLDSSSSITGISFMDDLGSALAGLVATDLPQNDVCGVGSSLSGTDVVTFANGTLAPGASCTFSVTLVVPAGTPLGTSFDSSTSDISGTVEGLLVTGDPAEDELEISSILFTKSFDGGSSAGGSPVLTYTLENLSTTTAVDRLGFTDDLDSTLAGLVATGLPESGVCGVGSELLGTSIVEFTGGSLAPGESCSFSVSLIVPGDASPGTYLSATSSLRSDGLVLGVPAAASLELNPAPGFSKSFALNPSVVGAVNTLTFTVDNSASTAEATGLDFADSLPVGMLVATPSNASTTCAGGTLTAVEGSISYTGGSIPAGSICTVTVDVVGNTAGDYLNTSGALSSSLGNSGSATASVRVNPLPVFSKAFTPSEILVGEKSTLTLTIDNSGSSVDATAVSFSDQLPAGMTVAAVPNASTTAVGGTLSAIAGSDVVSYSGGIVPAGGVATVSVDVLASSEGGLVNTSEDLTTSLGNSGRASATLTVNSQIDLVVTTLVSGDPLIAGVGAQSIEVTVTNNGPSNATGLVLSDVLTIPTGVSIDSTTPSAGSLVGGGWTLGALDAGASETLVFELSAAASAAEGINVISNVATVTAVDQTVVNPGDDSSTVSTSLVREVDMVISATESADPVIAGSGVGNLTYVVSATNNGPSNASGVELTNLLTMPAGVTIFSVTPGAGTVSGSTWSLGNLAPGQGSTLTIVLTVSGSASAGVDVIALNASVTVNEALVNLGDDSAGVATTIEAPVDLVVDVAGSSDSVVAGSSSGNLSYVVTISNQGPAAATGVELSNALGLSAGVSVDSVTPSAGTFVDPTWSVGALPLGGSATLTVVLTVDGSTAAGTDVISDTATLVSADQPLINTGDDSDTAYTSVAQTVDLALAVSESSDPFVVCPNAPAYSHTLTISNHGPGDATGVNVDFSQTLPAGVTITGVTPSGTTGVSGDRWAVGTLTSGATETLLVEFEIAVSVSGSVDSVTTDAGVATVEESDTDGSNDQASVSTSVVSAVSLAISPTTTNPVRYFGTFVHQVRVTNGNPAPVAGIRLFVTQIPANTIVLNADVTADFGNPLAPRDYVLINDTLAPGETRDVTVKYLKTGSQENFTPGYEASLLKAPESSVRVIAVSPYPYKVGPKSFRHSLSVINLGDEPVPAFQLFVGNLPTNVSLAGESGSGEYGLPPVELPYVLVGQTLAPGESRIIHMDFGRSNSNHHFIPVYRTRIVNDFAVPSSSLIASVQEEASVDRTVGAAMTVFTQSGVLVEWDVTPGGVYQIQYSDDLHSWNSDSEVLTAVDERIQWFDDELGFDRLPEGLSKRYYRLVDISDAQGE